MPTDARHLRIRTIEPC